MHKIFANWLIESKKKAIQKNPDDAKAWSKLFSIFVEQNNSADFLAICRESIRRHPASQQPWKYLHMASEGQISQSDSLAFCQTVVREHPECERAWSQLDMESEKLTNAGAEWVSFCREIVAHHPNNMYAWTHLMRELKHDAKNADLVSACLQAIKLKPDAQTWLNLADAYAAQSKFDEAITSYEKALELKPDYLVAMNGLGCVYHTQGRYEDAILLYQRATRVRKDDATPWVWLALAYMQIGELQKARDAISKVKTALPLVATMLLEELSTLPNGERKVTDPRIAINRLTFQSPA